MTDRREFLTKAGLGAVALAAPISWSAVASAQEMLPRRPIPGTHDSLPIIGLGNARVFADGNLDASRELIETFRTRGGAYIDCIFDLRFTVAEVVGNLDAANDLFLGPYFMEDDEALLRANIQRILKLSGKKQLDLVHAWPEFAVPNWDTMRNLKDEGLTKYIGISRHKSSYYETMMKVMETGTVDFVQVNYSPLEREADERILPMAMDKGIAVNINRAFLNGDYFGLVSGHELPEWAAEFDCESWAQFALKYSLSHPAVTCVLTETSNPKHVIDNIGAGFGAMPDEATRERIVKHLQSL
jgi:diketogulonate reductase-like aldo/keto reductase